MMTAAPYRYFVSSSRWCSEKEYMGIFVCLPDFRSDRHYFKIQRVFISCVHVNIHLCKKRHVNRVWVVEVLSVRVSERDLFRSIALVEAVLQVII